MENLQENPASLHEFLKKILTITSASYFIGRWGKGENYPNLLPMASQ